MKRLLLFLRVWRFRMAWRMRVERVGLWLGRTCPDRLAYWVIIAKTSEYSCTDEAVHREVPDITWDEVCRWLEGDRVKEAA